MEILVVYYSLTGNTQKIAEIIASELDAEIMRIEDLHSRASVFDDLRIIFEIIFRRQCEIRPINVDPSEFDLIILGAPVWIKNLATPMRTYILSQKTKLKKVAFFCTEVSNGGDRTFETMSILCGKQPTGILEVTEDDLKSDIYVTKTNAFINRIRTNK